MQINFKSAFLVILLCNANIKGMFGTYNTRIMLNRRQYPTLSSWYTVEEWVKVARRWTDETAQDKNTENPSPEDRTRIYDDEMQLDRMIHELKRVLHDRDVNLTRDEVQGIQAAIKYREAVLGPLKH